MLTTRIVDIAARTVSLALGIALAGCLHIYKPFGRQFEPAPAPGDKSALVYVYHVSPSRSVLDYGERIFVDGTELGLLHTYFGDACEYRWLHLASGLHRFEVETNSTWLAPAPKNPVTLELTAKSGSIYVVRVETSRNARMSFGVSVGTSGGVQSHAGGYPAAGTKTIDYSQNENVDYTELRDCHIAEAPAVQ